MKEQILLSLISLFVKLLSPENLKKFADTVLDFIEDTVVKSGTKWDDALILPLCDTIRSTFDIPDNDEV